MLTGAGGTFCAGADLHAVAAGDGNRVTEDGDGPMGVTRLRLGKPVIAAIEGHAVAGGLEVALWCDLRVAAATPSSACTAGASGCRWSTSAPSACPRLIGHSRAMDLILTGRGVDGDEALRDGPRQPRHRAGRGAGRRGRARPTSSPRSRSSCLRGDRLSAIEQWGMTEDDALQNELRHGLATVRSGETREGAKAFGAGKGRGGAF